MRRISFSTSVILVVVVVGCTAKSPAAPTTIPVPLVSALIDDRGLSTRVSPKYTVGQLPPGYPVVLVPTGPVRIVGGMTTGDEMVAVFADSTRRLAAVMEEIFQQQGYARPLATPASGFSPGYGPYSTFCGDSGTVAVEPLVGSNRTFARVTYRRTRTAGSCRTNESARSARQLVLPELKAPEGVRVSRSGGGSGTDEVNSRAEVTGTDLSAATIVGHYAAQLVAAGWTTETPAISQRVAAQYFESKDPSGRSWEGVLMASGSKTALTISLTMRRRGSR